MLVLTRKKHESILIGDEGDIVVKIIEISGSYVRLGIEAPKNVPVHREEIFKRIKAQSEEEVEE